MAVAVNLVSIPALHLAFFGAADYFSAGEQGLTLLAGLELAALVGEAAAYRWLAGWREGWAWAASGAANPASFGTSQAPLIAGI